MLRTCSTGTRTTLATIPDIKDYAQIKKSTSDITSTHCFRDNMCAVYPVIYRFDLLFASIHAKLMFLSLPGSMITLTTVTLFSANPSRVAFASSSSVLTKMPFPPTIFAICSYRASCIRLELFNLSREVEDPPPCISFCCFLVQSCRSAVSPEYIPELFMQKIRISISCLIIVSTFSH